MTLQAIIRTHHRWEKIPGTALFALLLAATLAACGIGIPGGGMPSFPQGRLSLLHLPAPYVLPGQILSGPDDNLWFPAIAYTNFATSNPAGAIGRLTPAGHFQMFALPDPDSYPTTITLASDGSVWFTAFQGNGTLNPPGDTKPRFTGGYYEIGHMTPDGKFHFFALPLSIAHASLGGIATGPDGNLWFTENLDTNGSISQRIGHMTPAGVFSEFPLQGLPANSNLLQVISGPDGNLWFSIESSDKDYNAVGAFGRITPRGAVSIFPAGKYNVPLDMTIGPDHNLWFTTYQGVGQITMTGNIHMFDPDPHSSASSHISPGGITTGPDGALWFSTANVAVGRVTTTGTFTFHPFPPNTHFDSGSSSLSLGELKGIVKGADGTLWLTNDSQIGHFV